MKCVGPADIRLLRSKSDPRKSSFEVRREPDVVGFRSEWMISNAKGPWILNTVQAHGIGWPKPCNTPTHFCNVEFMEAFRILRSGGNAPTDAGQKGHIREAGGRMAFWPLGKNPVTAPLKTRGDTQSMGINIKKAAMGALDPEHKPSDVNPTGRSGKHCNLCKVHIRVDWYIDDMMDFIGNPFPSDVPEAQRVDYVLFYKSVVTDCICKEYIKESRPRYEYLPMVGLVGGSRTHCSWHWEWDICNMPQCLENPGSPPPTTGPRRPTEDLPRTESPEPMPPPDEPPRGGGHPPVVTPGGRAGTPSGGSSGEPTDEGRAEKAGGGGGGGDRKIDHPRIFRERALADIEPYNGSGVPSSHVDWALPISRGPAYATGPGGNELLRRTHIEALARVKGGAPVIAIGGGAPSVTRAR